MADGQFTHPLLDLPEFTSARMAAGRQGEFQAALFDAIATVCQTYPAPIFLGGFCTMPRKKDKRQIITVILELGAKS